MERRAGGGEDERQGRNAKGEDGIEGKTKKGKGAEGKICQGRKERNRNNEGRKRIKDKQNTQKNRGVDGAGRRGT